MGTLQISTLEICNLFSQACWERVRARATRYVGCSSKHHHHSRHVYIFPIQDSSRFEQQEYLKIFEVHITWIVGVSIDNHSYYIVWCRRGNHSITEQHRVQDTEHKWSFWYYIPASARLLQPHSQSLTRAESFLFGSLKGVTLPNLLIRESDIVGPLVALGLALDLLSDLSTSPIFSS